MNNVWRPSHQHTRYMYEPSFLEDRFGVARLDDLLHGDVCGVARYVIMPSFSGESVCTLTYRPDGVELELAVAEHSLWCSLSDGPWTQPVCKRRSLTFDEMPDPLHAWPQLKAAARVAPSVSVAMIDGREYVTEDGIGFRHHVVDRQDEIYARWANPTPEASNHVAQMVLVNAYDALLRSTSKTPHD